MTEDDDDDDYLENWRVIRINNGAWKCVVEDEAFSVGDHVSEDDDDDDSDGEVRVLACMAMWWVIGRTRIIMSIMRMRRGTNWSKGLA